MSSRRHQRRLLPKTLHTTVRRLEISCCSPPPVNSQNGFVDLLTIDKASRCPLEEEQPPSVKGSYYDSSDRSVNVIYMPHSLTLTHRHTLLWYIMTWTTDERASIAQKQCGPGCLVTYPFETSSFVELVPSSMKFVFPLSPASSPD